MVIWPLGIVIGNRQAITQQICNLLSKTSSLISYHLLYQQKNNLQEATSNISNKDPPPQQKTHQTSQHNQPNSSNLFPFEKVLFCNLIGPPGLVMHAITCLIVGKVPNRFDQKKPIGDTNRAVFGGFLVSFQIGENFRVGGILYRKHPFFTRQLSWTRGDEQWHWEFMST